jgi:hypothetical protein
MLHSSTIREVPMSPIIRRLYLEVSDPVDVVKDLSRELFVPTRLPFQLGEVIELSLRLKRVSRPLDVPVIVIGRRLPRPGSLLSAGVIVRAANRSHPVLEILQDVIEGSVVDLEARLQERLRLPARVIFASLDEARSELAGLLEDGVALDLDAPAVRGDRLALEVVVGGSVVLNLHTLVHRLQLQRDTTACVLTVLEESRAALNQFLRRTEETRRRG